MLVRAGGFGIDVVSAHGVVSVEPTTVGETLDDLLARGVSCAPHVAGRLICEVTADPETIVAVVLRLDADQRQGLRPLPTPLPLVAPIEALYDDLDLDGRDHELLVATSLSFDDALARLLDFDGRSAEQIAAGRIGSLLDIHAGRVRLADPRIAIWLSAVTAASTTAKIHARLCGVYEQSGDRAGANWHRARASLHDDPDVGAELTRLARGLSEAGRSDLALHIAAEAVEHSAGVGRDEAVLVAGVSAIAAGFAAEASDRLASLFPGGDERFRLQGLGGLLVAQAHLRGTVPDIDADVFRPRTGQQEDWYSWARAAAFAAVLCAERDDRRGMRSWLEALREGCARADSAVELRDPVVALAWLIVGDRDGDDACGSGPLTGQMLQALRAAIGGDVDRGLRLLAAADSGITTETDPFVAGFEFTPLVGAYRAVIEVLLLMWSGDIAAARDRMLRASIELPVAIPFAGLGVVLARRLDLAVLGRLGPFARALTAALPVPLRIDQLVDRGIQAFLDGSSEEALACMRLWSDRGAPQSTLSVPGLEEAAFDADPASGRHQRIEPPEIALVQQLRTTITRCSDQDWRTDRLRVAATARTLMSPFSRGRVEAMIGNRSLVAGDPEGGRKHLTTACSLLEISGATAWSRAVEVQVRALDAQDRPRSRDDDPLASCRSVWQPVLTARELQVAMLAVEGTTNRDIAHRLHVSVRTVEVHLGRAFAKLDVRTRVELTVLAHRVARRPVERTGSAGE